MAQTVRFQAPDGSVTDPLPVQFLEHYKKKGFVVLGDDFGAADNAALADVEVYAEPVIEEPVGIVDALDEDLAEGADADTVVIDAAIPDLDFDDSLDNETTPASDVVDEFDGEDGE